MFVNSVLLTKIQNYFCNSCWVTSKHNKPTLAYFQARINRIIKADCQAGARCIKHKTHNIFFNYFMAFLIMGYLVADSIRHFISFLFIYCEPYM